MLHVHTFTFNALQENTYLLYDENGSAVVVDAGCYGRVEEGELLGFVQAHHLKVEALLSTHSHIDHVLGNAFVKKTFGVKLYIHPIDEDTLRSVPVYAPTYGFANYETSTPDAFLNAGDTFRVGNTSLQVLFVPGHAPGHIAFYQPEQQFVIGGDVLFAGSVGRSDLPGGNFDVLAQSIRGHFYTLPDDTVVHPGHGPSTTVGYEKRTNPFVRQT